MMQMYIYRLVPEGNHHQPLRSGSVRTHPRLVSSTTAAAPPVSGQIKTSLKHNNNHQQQQLQQQHLQQVVLHQGGKNEERGNGNGKGKGSVGRNKRGLVSGKKIKERESRGFTKQRQGG